MEAYWQDYFAILALSPKEERERFCLGELYCKRRIAKAVPLGQATGQRMIVKAVSA